MQIKLWHTLPKDSHKEPQVFIVTVLREKKKKKKDAHGCQELKVAATTYILAHD